MPKILILNSDGTRSAIDAQFSSPLNYPAGEVVTAGMFVRLYDDAGTVKIGPADATTGKPSFGFVTQDGAIDSLMAVYAIGNNENVSALTPATTVFLGSNGAATSTAPTSSGAVVQTLGTALSATTMVVDVSEDPIFIN